MMSTYRKKIARIMDEIILFFMIMDATDTQFELQRTDEGYKITVRSDYNPSKRDHLQNLKKFLQTEKIEAMEECYWELAGIQDITEGSELAVLGSMIDQSDIRIHDDHVTMELFKHY